MSSSNFLSLFDVEGYAYTAWLPIRSRLDRFFAQPATNLPPLPSTRINAWQLWENGEWQERSPEGMHTVICYDFEAKQDFDRAIEFWYPTLCVAYDDRWWCWYPPDEEQHLVVDFPINRILVGQNSVSYDRRYLSSSYDLDDKSYHLDTMHLNTIVAGLSESDTSSIRILWKMFDSQHKKGIRTPEWYRKGCPGSLEAMVPHYLGYEWGKLIDKSVRDQYQKDPTKVTAATLFEYCCTDVLATKELASVLFKRANLEFIPSPITWLGMGEVNRSRYYLNDWDGFIERSQQQCDAVVEQLAEISRSLVDKATPENAPYLDWKKYVRGENKGKEKWRVTLEKSKSVFGGQIETQLLQLCWDGEPVQLVVNGRKAIWCVNGDRDRVLPHPSGKKEDNLGTPLCADYIVYAKNGRLTSKVISQEALIDIFNKLISISQWEAYQARYRKLYRGHDTRTGQEICVADLNGTGTISRRAISGVWVVLPKPKKTKIGSDVMRYIGCPDGYKIVSADFVSQESRIAAAIMSDCRLGAHNSTEWSRSVLSGEKSQGTDTHTLTANRCGTDRDAGKKVNFCTIYGGGLAQTATTIKLAKGCDDAEATSIAKDFLDWLKGTEGVAKEMFSSLKMLSNTPHIRTYLLGVKQPDTINAAYLPKQNELVTTRNNWHIQSAGQDELHLLIFLVRHLSLEAGIDATFACSVHDRAAFFFKAEEAEQGAAILNQAYKMLMYISYEQGVFHWEKYVPKIFGEKRPRLQPMLNWLNFEKVYVSDVLMEE